MTQVIFLLHDRSGYLIHVSPCSDDVMVKFQSWYQCHTQAHFPKPGFLITTLWFIDLFSILLPRQMYGMKAFHNIVSAPSRKICMHLLLAGVLPEIIILYAKRKIHRKLKPSWFFLYFFLNAYRYTWDYSSLREWDSEIPFRGQDSCSRIWQDLALPSPRPGILALRWINPTRVYNEITFIALFFI